MDFNYFMWNRTLGTIFKALERIVCLETYRMYRDVREKGWATPTQGCSGSTGA